MKLKLHTRKAVVPYAYLLPVLLTVTVVLGIPLINLIWYSFADVSLVGKLKKWVGFKNYRYLFTGVFGQTLLRTAIWVVCGVAGIFVVGTILSLALNKPLRGRGLLRALVIIPWVIPHVFAGTMWMWTLNSQSGIVNTILQALHLIDSPITFLSETMALPTVIWMRIWKGVPFLVMSLLSAMQAIPSEVEEAAKLDGARGPRYFFSVLLPLLKPVMVMSGTILMAWSITIFDIVYVVTGGGPAKATELLSISIYKKAFVDSNLGGASAIAVFTMLLVGVLGYFLMRRNMREEGRQ